MKASRRSFTEGEEAFARAAYDVLQDMEVGLGVSIGIHVGRTQRKGVFSIEIRAVSTGVGFESFTVAKLTEEWPNARAGSLGAQFFAMSNKLYAMAENVMRERRKEPA